MDKPAVSFNKYSSLTLRAFAYFAKVLARFSDTVLKLQRPKTATISGRATTNPRGEVLAVTGLRGATTTVGAAMSKLSVGYFTLGAGNPSRTTHK